MKIKNWPQQDGNDLFEKWVATSNSISVKPWNFFGNTEVVKSWSVELTKAGVGTGAKKQAESPSDLEISGTKVVFECPDGEKCLFLARRVAEDIGAHFLYYGIFAQNKLDVSFSNVAAMLESTNPEARLLLYVEAPGLLVKPREQMFMSATDKAVIEEGGEDAKQVQQSVIRRVQAHASMLEEFAGILHGEFTRDRVIVVVGTNSIRELHPGLTGIDGINRAFRFPGRSDEQAGNDFIESFGKELFDESILKSPAKVGRMIQKHGWDDKNSIKTLKLHLLRKIRKANEDKVGFEDLLDIELRDVVEYDEESVPTWKKEKVAYHEAGHVVAALVSSDYTEIPEYCAAKPGRGFGGIMIHSMENPNTMPERFSEFQGFIRIALGGRAAEELMYGAGGITYGPASDLFEATRFARRYFGRFGFGPDWKLSQGGTETTTGRNLAVRFLEDQNEKGQEVEISLFDCPEVEASLYENVRRFLEQEYQATLDILREHRPLLEAVAARLQWDVIDKSEFEEIIDIYRSSKATKVKKLKAWASNPGKKS